VRRRRRARVRVGDDRGGRDDKRDPRVSDPGRGRRLARLGWLVGRAAGLLGRKAGLQGKRKKKKTGCCWATRGVGLKAKKE
jgi:hypothetical protein